VKLKRPAEATLRKYGLSVGDWNLIAFRQGERCALCKGLPPSGRLTIHERGLLCQSCRRKAR
jgi:hypothetical protein